MLLLLCFVVLAAGARGRRRRRRRRSSQPQTLIIITKPPTKNLTKTTKKVVVVTDPALFGPLLRGPRRIGKLLRPYRMFELMANPPMPNILSSPENAHWSTVRRAVVPAFSMANVRASMPDIVAVTGRLLRGFAEIGPEARLELDSAMQRLTADVIGVFAFNRDFGGTDLRCASFLLGSVGMCVCVCA